MFNIRHVVFDRREGLRWYFIDTETKREYFLSLNPKDIKYLMYGVNFLLPPLNKKHIKGTW
jgi:hypothetical protein